jgi:hypothetical protein
MISIVAADFSLFFVIEMIDAARARACNPAQTDVAL